MYINDVGLVALRVNYRLAMSYIGNSHNAEQLCILKVFQFKFNQESNQLMLHVKPIFDDS